MNVSRRQSGSVIIFDLSGRMTIGETNDFINAVQTAVNAGGRKIIVNLTSLSMIDSSGVAALVKSKNTSTQSGGTIKLLHVEDKVREVLSLGNTLAAFESFDDEIDAISSFR